jgi:cytosine/adenosine deaminase-related metal-dependent hydrolase
MPWQQDEARAKMFAHYLTLCRMPGVKDYAWQRVKELDEQDLYKGIKDYIVEQMKNGAVK